MSVSATHKLVTRGNSITGTFLLLLFRFLSVCSHKCECMLVVFFLPIRSSIKYIFGLPFGFPFFFYLLFALILSAFIYNRARTKQKKNDFSFLLFGQSSFVVVVCFFFYWIMSMCKFLIEFGQFSLFFWFHEEIQY